MGFSFTTLAQRRDLWGAVDVLLQDVHNVYSLPANKSSRVARSKTRLREVFYNGCLFEPGDCVAISTYAASGLNPPAAAAAAAFGGGPSGSSPPGSAGPSTPTSTGAGNNMPPVGGLQGPPREYFAVIREFAPAPDAEEDSGERYMYVTWLLPRRALYITPGLRLKPADLVLGPHEMLPQPMSAITRSLQFKKRVPLVHCLPGDLSTYQCEFMPSPPSSPLRQSILETLAASRAAARARAAAAASANPLVPGSAISSAACNAVAALQASGGLQQVPSTNSDMSVDSVGSASGSSEALRTASANMHAAVGWSAAASSATSAATAAALAAGVTASAPPKPLSGGTGKQSWEKPAKAQAANKAPIAIHNGEPVSFQQWADIKAADTSSAGGLKSPQRRASPEPSIDLEEFAAAAMLFGICQQVPVCLV